MSSSEIAPELYHFLNGNNLASKQGEAMMLLTVSEEGWPHTAMISVGEIVALSPAHLRIALWPNTETSRNMSRTNQATLVVIYEGRAHYTRLKIASLGRVGSEGLMRDGYEATVVWTRQDMAKYAHITSGIQIELLAPDEVISRWTETIQSLLEET